ncbi:MAG: hypothetical protein HOP15_17285 [Planctomycetes bacterium]|nr:hypothetical protein [Planctomycetota bacterium]
MTEIEIRDPDPSDPSAAGTTSASATESGPDSPYKNLLVPLVVVPALIVMVLVLVFALFSGVVGREDSPRENLERVLNGGFNDRRQAAFGLVRQVLVYQRARAQGEEPEWEIDASFLPELQAARAQLAPIQAPGDLATAFVLSSLMATLGEPAGVTQLLEMLELPDEVDPGSEYRMHSAMALGALAPDLAAPERERVRVALVRLLASSDSGLVLYAVAGLQKLPGEDTLAALKGMLANELLEVRASAALSLAVLGDRAGLGLLEEMLSLAPYEAERVSHPRKWPSPVVSESRVKALDALAALGAAPNAEALRRLAEGDLDPNFRRAVLARVSGEAAR